MAAQPFIGQIQAFGFQFSIVGWVPCDGRMLSIAEYTTLFALIGTTYGGDGVNTFGIPDLRGRVPLGQGNGQGLTPRVMGQFAGTEITTILQSQMPAHTHVLTATGGSFMVSSAIGTSPTPSAAVNTIGAANDTGGLTNNVYNNLLPDITMNTGAGGSSVIISSNGGGQPFSNMEPYLTINYAIATEGIFPTRN